MNIIRWILLSFPIIIFFIPTFRIGTIPIRFEDLLMVLIVIIFFLSNIPSVKIRNIKLVFILLICLTVISIYSSSIEWMASLDINIKSLIFALSITKYYVWFKLLGTINLFDDVFKNRFIKVLMISFVTQIMIILFQKFGILGFSDGFIYNFIIKYYAIPNIYATSTDIAQLASTHMNFSFRPAGIIGSSTVTGMSLLFLGLSLYYSTKKIIWKFLTLISLALSFAKIAIVAYFIIELLLPIILSNWKKVIRTIGEFIVISPLFLYAIIELGVIDNLIRSLDGTDRGITHRSDIISYVFSQDWLALLFGSYNSLPFSAFDSGVLLTIYRHGIIYFIIEYLFIYLMIISLSCNRMFSLFSIIIIFLSDLTFGSVYNPVFSNVIILIFIMSVSIFKKDKV